MEFFERTHFGGSWSDGERRLLDRAVREHELAATGDGAPGDPDEPAPWVCLRVVIDGAPYFLGYRLGDDVILKAASAEALAHLVAADGQASGQPDGHPDAAPAPDTLPRGGIPAYRLRKVVDFVRAEFGCAITVREMAEQVGMSEYHFAREFKRSLGLTPRQYLTQCRLEEAQRMLRTTDLQVSEVARRVGFTSASHFAEVFRKRVGLRPREFRERHRA